MEALVLDAELRTANVEYINRPRPTINQLLVHVKALSLNPIDPLYVSHPLAKSGRVIGSDFAGKVVELGSEVPDSARLSPGTLVAGFLQGACSVNDRPGAFAEYLVVPWDLVWKVPESVSIEYAAGVSLVALTAAQAIYCRLGLQAPFEFDCESILGEHPEWDHCATSGDEREVVNFFIYGASTSVALYAAQMVRLSGRASGKAIKLFGAASKARWDLLTAAPYGYDGLVDYRDKDWLEQMMGLTSQAGIHYAFDCISEGESVQLVCSTLARDGRMAIVRSREGGAWKGERLTNEVEPRYGAVWEGLGEEVQYQGLTVKRSPSTRAFTVAFYDWLSKSLGSDILPNPIRLMPGGLRMVVDDGFKLLGAGGMEERQVEMTEDWMKPVSAEKLVYKI
ncbi:GroES-like protein [Plenodomus tracheiphilus IPT5]|uniref:GroES-like protein n=1 Tax=Plenodomus tracheiphilus IPT5 TaxID=1408161 RepID=A0A6A7AWE2_9PLEO|nr:GroES-like protein [Plenodomus tracheiphilus IPT5]